jgi:hypothetical protein
MVIRDRAWRRYRKETKTIHNMKRYRWVSCPVESIEGDVDLSWYQGINSRNWHKSKKKTESFGNKDSWSKGDSPIKKYYRSKVKKLTEYEIEDFYKKIYR